MLGERLICNALRFDYRRSFERDSASNSSQVDHSLLPHALIKKRQPCGKWRNPAERWIDLFVACLSFRFHFRLFSAAIGFFSGIGFDRDLWTKERGKRERSTSSECFSQRKRKRWKKAWLGAWWITRWMEAGNLKFWRIRLMQREKWTRERSEASDSEVSGANYLRLIGYDVSGQRDGIHESPCADSYRVRDTA